MLTVFDALLLVFTTGGLRGLPFLGSASLTSTI